MNKATSHIGCALGAISVWSLIGSLALAAWVLGYQSFIWLQTGTWPKLTLSSEGINIPPTNWLGVNKIIAYLMYDLPLAAFLIAAGFLVALVVLTIGNLIMAQPASKKRY